MIAYNNNIVVGARKWSGRYTDIPAMGSDGFSSTFGYCENGDIPTFKLYIDRTGELIDLNPSSIEPWSDLSTTIIGQLNQAAPIPESFEFSYPYPNPFNPSTTINFAIPADTDVSIAVYNLQGREVVSLANGSYDAGYHQVIWNADSHSSGIYFVKMVAGDYINTQKLMLVK